MGGLLFIDLVTRLSQINVIIGIVICALGFGLALIAKKATGSLFKKRELAEENRTASIMNIIGLALMCIGMVVMIVQ